MSWPRRRAADHHLGQRRHVAQPEVQPLPRQRMDAVRRVAGQRQPRHGAALRQREPERIAVARPDELDLAEEVAEPRPQRGKIPRRVERRRSPRPAPAVSVQTIDERSPGSGRIASGPAGMKNWCAIAAVRPRVRHRRRPARSGRSPSRAAGCPARARHLAVAAVAADQQRRRRASCRRRASPPPRPGTTAWPTTGLDGRCAISAAPPPSPRAARRAGSGPRGCAPSGLRRSPGRRSAGRAATAPSPGAAVADLDRLDRLRLGGEPAPEPERRRAAAASRAPAHRRGRRTPARPARRAARASSTMLVSPPCASASASTGPFSPPPTIRTSQSLRHCRGSIAPRLARLSSRRRPARLRRPNAGGAHVRQLALDDGERPRPRDRGRRDRPARADRGLPRRDRQPPARAPASTPAPRPSAPAPRPPPPPTAPRPGCAAAPLDGVPISWKDLFDTAGVATEAGSALLRGPGARARRRGARHRHPRRARLPRQDPPDRARLLRPRRQPGHRHPAQHQRPRARPRRLLLRRRRLGRLRPRRRRRSARTPAARCGCRRPGTTSSG